MSFKVAIAWCLQPRQFHETKEIEVSSTGMCYKYIYYITAG